MKQKYTFLSISTMVLTTMVFALLIPQQTLAQVCEPERQEELEGHYAETITTLEDMFNRAIAESKTAEEELRMNNGESGMLSGSVRAAFNSIRSVAEAGKRKHNEYRAYAEESRFSLCKGEIEKSAGDILGYIQERNEDIQIALMAIQGEIRDNRNGEETDEEREDRAMRQARAMCPAMKRVRVDRHIRQIAERTEQMRGDRQERYNPDDPGASAQWRVMPEPVDGTVIESEERSTPLKDLEALAREPQFKECVPYISHRLRMVRKMRGQKEGGAPGESAEELLLPREGEITPLQGIPVPRQRIRQVRKALNQPEKAEQEEVKPEKKPRRRILVRQRAENSPEEPEKQEEVKDEESEEQQEKPKEEVRERKSPMRNLFSRIRNIFRR